VSYPRDSIDPNRYQALPNEDPATPFRNLDTGPMTSPVTTIDPRPDAWDDVVDSGPFTIDEVVERQRERFGGVKIGSAFFGWLIAVGVAAIITGLLAATGVALGFDVVQSPRGWVRDAPLDEDTVTWIGVSALLTLLFAAFYCGGYVAGRMARFSGVAQGLAVWVWALVMAIVVALAAVALGSRFDFLGEASAFPSVPVSEGVLVIAGVIAAVVVAVASLGGAIFGGVIGVRYHRRVDRVGLDG
jgi:hypothetical protein